MLTNEQVFLFFILFFLFCTKLLIEMKRLRRLLQAIAVEGQKRNLQTDYVLKVNAILQSEKDS